MDAVRNAWFAAKGEQAEMLTSDRGSDWRSGSSGGLFGNGTALPACDLPAEKPGPGMPKTAAAVAPSPSKASARRRRSGRTASRPAVSLANRRMRQGKQFVPAEGNGSLWYFRTKRALDVAGATALLVALSPVMLVTWVVLMATTRGKPIYRQERLGYRGRPFTLYKFRTMVPDATKVQHRVENEKDGPIFKNRRDPRVTRIGRFLRSTSIDEFPQLLNVLAGQMALVGPRPPLAREVAQYEPWQRRRLSVKPGLTCLWQVSGRSEVGFVDWVRMDLWYVRNQNLLVDLKLLSKTPVSVLSRRGAY